jgi:hypothetical protein
MEIFLGDYSSVHNTHAYCLCLPSVGGGQYNMEDDEKPHLPMDIITKILLALERAGMLVTSLGELGTPA